MKKITALVTSFFGYNFLVVKALAAEKPLLKDPSNIKDVQVESLPQLVINYLFIGAAFLAVVYLMFGGIRFIMSKGDKTGVADARKHIIYAIVGLVIVLLTFAFINIIFKVLGADNPLSKGFVLPTLQNVNK